MQWFKHNSNASRVLPVRLVREKYNFHGLGVLWTMVERVVETNGLVTEEDLCNEFSSRRFGRKCVKDLIHGYGIFSVDEHGRVHCLLETLPDAMPEGDVTTTEGDVTTNEAKVSTEATTEADVTTTEATTEGDDATTQADVTTIVKADECVASDAAAKAAAPDSAPDATPDTTPDMSPDMTPDTTPDTTPDSAPDPPSNACARIEEKENKNKKKNKRESKREPGQKPRQTERGMAALLASAKSEKELKFYQAMQEQYPRVCSMSKPLSYDDYHRIRDSGYSQPLVLHVLNAMENYADLLKRYVSAKLTLMNWLKRE